MFRSVMESYEFLRPTPLAGQKVAALSFFSLVQHSFCVDLSVMEMNELLRPELLIDQKVAVL
jgi:hypothetical protein